MRHPARNEYRMKEWWKENSCFPFPKPLSFALLNAKDVSPSADDDEGKRSVSTCRSAQNRKIRQKSADLHKSDVLFFSRQAALSFSLFLCRLLQKHSKQNTIVIDCDRMPVL